MAAVARTYCSFEPVHGKKFVGRKPELEIILQPKAGVVSLSAPPGWGVSSVLEEARERSDGSFIPLSGCRGEEDLIRFLSHVLSTGNDYHFFLAQLARIDERAAIQQKFRHVFIDDFSAVVHLPLAEAKGVLEFFHQLVELDWKATRFVLGLQPHGIAKITELLPDFFEQAESYAVQMHTLGPMTGEDVRAMIALRCQEWGYAMTANAQQAIYERSAGIPFLVHALLEDTMNGTRERTIVLEHIPTAEQIVCYSSAARMLRQVWNSLSSLQRDALRLASSHPGMPVGGWGAPGSGDRLENVFQTPEGWNMLNAAVRLLEEFGIVEKEGDGYRIAGPVLRYWATVFGQEPLSVAGPSMPEADPTPREAPAPDAP